MVEFDDDDDDVAVGRFEAGIETCTGFVVVDLAETVVVVVEKRRRLVRWGFDELEA